MIDVLYIWNRLADYGQKYMSGTDKVDAFNSKLAEVQAEVYNDLSPYYETNIKVRDILRPWAKKLTGTATSGVITATVASYEFDRVISIGITIAGAFFGANEITEEELVEVARIPQRRPDSAKKQVYYLTSGTNIITLAPLEALAYTAYVLVMPKEAKIAFTLTSTDDEDVMTYNSAGSTDLEWNKNAQNIIIYKMLEKYGISNRELWLTEYAKLGIVLENQTKA